MTLAEKEQIMVKRVLAKDMAQFPEIPYQLNSPIKKVLAKNAHPFAYIDLNQYNQDIAKREISMVNRILLDAIPHIPLLSKKFLIKVEELAFQKYSPGYGYTRIMCTPYTFSGKIAKYPLFLSFMSRADRRSYFTHGELYYGKNGKVLKGSVVVNRESIPFKNSVMWDFSFKTVQNILTLAEAKSSLRPDKYGRPTTVYKLDSL